jgi:hypothetical protein
MSFVDVRCNGSCEEMRFSARFVLVVCRSRQLLSARLGQSLQQFLLGASFCNHMRDRVFAQELNIKASPRPQSPFSLPESVQLIPIMASEQIRAPGSKPGENMLWGGRFTGLTYR